jgi:hypothetical protein
MIEETTIDDDVVEMEGDDDIEAGGDTELGTEIIHYSDSGDTGVPVLPMPARLVQKRTARSLGSAVRGYFYPAYNSNARFKRHLQSVGNNDSVTKNRMFDRFIAVSVIREMARAAKDTMTAEAPEGHIYGCLVGIMRSENLGLKLRREQYRRLTHQQQAAE